MKITDRLKTIDGVDFVSWHPAEEKVVVTLKENADKEAVKIKVWKTITDVYLQDSIKIIDFVYM